jgi:hypothetical protein
MNFIQWRQQLAFFIAHSWRDLARNGTSSLFALFCICLLYRGGRRGGLALLGLDDWR